MVATRVWRDPTQVWGHQPCEAGRPAPSPSIRFSRVTGETSNLGVEEDT